MARLKLGSRILAAARLRLASIKAIDPDLNLGNTLSTFFYEATIQALSAKIAVYNGLLATIDGLRSEIRADEVILRRLSEQMLMGVGCKFGKDSCEYKKAGGVLKSERKRPKRG